MGQNLEKAGKPRPALETYRRIAAEFGDTSSAKEAAARIKALAP
jgi:TolA-binding protein